MHITTPTASGRTLSRKSGVKSTESLRPNDGGGKVVLMQDYHEDIAAEWERRYDMKYGPGQH